MRSPIPYLLLVAAALAGCSKSVLRETDYVLKPLVQLASGDILQPVEGARAYAFDADTAAWTVASYDDALAGVVTSRTNPAERITVPSATAEPLAEGELSGRLSMHLDRPSQLVVAVDPADRLYAFTQVATPENLPSLYVTLLFKPYREGREYKEGDWIFRNDFYVPLSELDCLLVPMVQHDEEGDEEALAVSSTAVRAYAYAADTTLWRIASYQDALNGVITSKSDPEQRRDTPNFTAYPDTEAAAYRMTVSDESLMVVVVDRTASRYAYCQVAVDLQGEPPVVPVVFRPWRRRYVDVERGWRMVDESFQPAADAARIPLR